MNVALPAKSNRLLMVMLVFLLVLVRPETGGHGGPLDALSNISPAGADVDVVRDIVFPVAYPADFTDTFGACRDGCSRSHQGVDIFAPTLTPLIAAADGVIVAERRNATGNPGNKIVIEDAEGWRYSYFHVNNDNPGTDDNANPQSWIMAGDLRIGDEVTAGQVIGYLGDSGNAEQTPPHLHFEIKPPGRSQINPTASASAAVERGAVVTLEDLASSAGDRAEWEFVVEDWYDIILGRAPTDSEFAAWTDRLANGLGTEADLVGDLAMAAPYREPEGVALRAHIVAFSELPSATVLDTLADIYRAELDPAAVVDAIVTSREYREVGSPSDAAQIEDLTMALDVKLETWPILQVVRAYRAVDDRMPDANELETWVEYLDAGGLMVDVVEGVLDGELPGGSPLATAYDSDDLGYVAGVNVRQGPIDLDPFADGSDDGSFELASGFDVADIDFELSVDRGDESDTANLLVRIPLDELAEARASGADISIELSLTQPADPADDATADAEVQLVLTTDDGDPFDDGDTDDGFDYDDFDDDFDDDDDAPVSVPTPTTRPPTTTTTTEADDPTTTTVDDTTSSTDTTTPDDTTPSTDTTTPDDTTSSTDTTTPDDTTPSTDTTTPDDTTSSTESTDPDVVTPAPGDGAPADPDPATPDGGGAEGAIDSGPPTEDGVGDGDGSTEDPAATTEAPVAADRPRVARRHRTTVPPRP